VTINCQSPIVFDEEGFGRSEADSEKLAGLFNALGFTRLLSQMGLGAGEADTSRPPSKAASAVRKGQGSLFDEPQEAAAARPEGKTYILVDTPTSWRNLSRTGSAAAICVDTVTTQYDPMRAELVG
jgi:hypothetical protein